MEEGPAADTPAPGRPATSETQPGRMEEDAAGSEEKTVRFDDERLTEIRVQGEPETERGGEGESRSPAEDTRLPRPKAASSRRTSPHLSPMSSISEAGLEPRDHSGSRSGSRDSRGSRSGSRERLARRQTSSASLASPTWADPQALDSAVSENKVIHSPREKKAVLRAQQEPGRSAHAQAQGPLGPARRAILEAVDAMEAENSDLRRQNTDMQNEMRLLRTENDSLRKQLEVNKFDEATINNKLDEASKQLHELKNFNNKLQSNNDDLNSKIEKLFGDITDREERQGKLLNENTKLIKQVENLKTELGIKEQDIRNAIRDLNSTKAKLDKTSRRNFDDHDIELLQELDFLKTEISDLRVRYRETQDSKEKILCEVRNMQVLIDTKEKELNNEKRRHSLLTKEFNSLLEENSHLKLQLRRRTNSTHTHDVTEETTDLRDRGGRLVGASSVQNLSKLGLATRGPRLTLPSARAAHTVFTSKQARPGPSHRGEGRAQESTKSSSPDTRSSPEESLPSVGGTAVSRGNTSIKDWKP